LETLIVRKHCLDFTSLLVPTEPELNDLLVELLISEKRFYEFHQVCDARAQTPDTEAHVLDVSSQHLQYHVLSDSIKVAKTLVPGLRFCYAHCLFLLLFRVLD